MSALDLPQREKKYFKTLKEMKPSLFFTDDPHGVKDIFSYLTSSAAPFPLLFCIV